ncbi:Asp-tRNA(Asn)/Glu-tRNA(Gln) amidotransferase subunit GatC [Kiritimatiellaeota bacterium B1221]|nr:Asp-tRNA(Asn)/Glu-tRNA(Gln) amidotransferase subunit GatC [Kiritimatiellaeota bacterium B1221]
MNESNPDLDHVDVTYVANLARIELSAEETEKFQKELDTVVAYIHQLNELDLDGIEPMSHPHPRENVLREDVPMEGPDRELMLANAPARVQDLIRVPQMMEDA